MHQRTKVMEQSTVQRKLEKQTGGYRKSQLTVVENHEQKPPWERVSE